MENSNRLRSDVNDGLNKVDALLESLAKNSTIKGVTGNEIARMQAVAESTRKRMNEQNLTVAVMALMKSGTDPSLSSKKCMLSLSGPIQHCGLVELAYTSGGLI